MKLLLIGIVIFLVVLYVFTYIRYKKMKKNRISAVDDFKKKYHKDEQIQNLQRSNDDFIAYTSKFNSTLDYVDREQLAEECQDMKQPKIKPKRLQF